MLRKLFTCGLILSAVLSAPAISIPLHHEINIVNANSIKREDLRVFFDEVRAHGWTLVYFDGKKEHLSSDDMKVFFAQLSANGTNDYCDIQNGHFKGSCVIKVPRQLFGATVMTPLNGKVTIDSWKTMSIYNVEYMYDRTKEGTWCDCYRDD